MSNPDGGSAFIEGFGGHIGDGGSGCLDSGSWMTREGKSKI